MKVELLEQPNISIALFGLGKNKGVTTGIKYRDFICAEIFYSDDLEGSEDLFSIDGDGLMGRHSKEYRQMLEVANKLCDKPEEHRKFLRQIFIAIEVTAPRYWWSEFDTYKIGTTAQSESTMHTILKTKLSYKNFADGSDDCVIESVLDRIDTVRQFKCNDTEKTIEIKKILPESFLQCRVVTLNYEVFKNIYRQRRNHKLPEWRWFCESLLEQLPYKNWITEIKIEE
jgi:hypothetical protein